MYKCMGEQGRYLPGLAIHRKLCKSILGGNMFRSSSSFQFVSIFAKELEELAFTVLMTFDQCVSSLTESKISYRMVSILCSRASNRDEKN